MRLSSTDRPAIATDTDYAEGRHYQWEVAAHEAEEEFFKNHSVFWEYDYRKRWLERYFTMTPHTVAHQVNPCSVCQEHIAQALLRGDKPFKAPATFREELKKLTQRIVAKMKPHIVGPRLF